MSSQRVCTLQDCYFRIRRVKFKMMARFIIFGKFAYIQPCLNQLNDVHKCSQYHADCKMSHLDRFWLFNNCSLYYSLWWTVWFPCKEVYHSSNYPSKSLTHYRWVFGCQRAYNKFIDINHEQPFRLDTNLHHV